MIQIRARAAGAAGVVAGVLLLTACGGDQAGSSGGGSNYVGGTGEVTQVAVEDRQPAPDLSGDTVDGDRLSLSDYRGQVVVLNVWGSWCPPCRAEASGFARVAEDTADQGVQFVGINTKEYSRENAQSFERSHGIEYPSLSDPDGRMLLEFPSGTLNAQSIPTTLVIDREGRIAARALTALTEDGLRDLIAPVLAEE
ncbi:TlpA family protein disulfide reductase [Streptomyces hoynatensis]|uniref:TlpA family protein disulfide reductase n=1 Tax=Streptomyces hoynatensis TaxID=1141874 RepID=A0A3A9Z0H6_9ACTN|nr:TlpA disulfide reductase family protein [Streptomyces hoynatensis]RKN41851.1 TlpA family protein disulfide reductase [Streptomyces hoynatensis]